MDTRNCFRLNAPLVLALAFLAPGLVAAEDEKAAPSVVREKPDPAKIEPKDAQSPPLERVTVATSQDPDVRMAASSTSIRGPEMQEIVQISQHRGDVQQLMLWRTPWHGPVLFHPGGVLYLETREAREKRLAAARMTEPAAEVEAETEGAESP